MTPDSAPRRLHSAKRAALVAAAAYAYDCLILFGYSVAGYVDIRVPVGVSTLFAALIGAVMWAHASRWSLKRRDPTLFLPRQLFAIVIVLGVALVAPQIGFQAFATLFAISAFSFMAPNDRSLVVSWIAIALAAAAIIFAVGTELAIPTSTLAGKALTAAVVFGLLARCVWIVMFVRKLRSRLFEKGQSLRKATARIEALAKLDEVTGLPNRQAIVEALREQMALSRRHGVPLSIAYVAVDHFKQINDAHGHLGGDRVLKLIAAEAAAAIRECDRIGRFGGEEFLIVLTGATLQAAGDPLERLRSRIARCDWSAIDPTIRVTITIGAAQYSPGEPMEALIRRADLALSRGKKAGRNRVVLNPSFGPSAPVWKIMNG